jgi:hypothetical protein
MNRRVFDGLIEPFLAFTLACLEKYKIMGHNLPFSGFN